MSHRGGSGDGQRGGPSQPDISAKRRSSNHQLELLGKALTSDYALARLETNT